MICEPLYRSWEVGDKEELRFETSADALHLSDIIIDKTQEASLTVAAPPLETSLTLIESSISSQQLECYKFCLIKNYDLDKDDKFVAWKLLKLLAENGLQPADVGQSVELYRFISYTVKPRSTIG